jgi:hypothetical protein
MCKNQNKPIPYWYEVRRVPNPGTKFCTAKFGSDVERKVEKSLRISLLTALILFRLQLLTLFESFWIASVIWDEKKVYRVIRSLKIWSSE